MDIVQFFSSLVVSYPLNEFQHNNEIHEAYFIYNLLKNHWLHTNTLPSKKGSMNAFENQNYGRLKKKKIKRRRFIFNQTFFCFCR